MSVYIYFIVVVALGEFVVCCSVRICHGGVVGW